MENTLFSYSDPEDPLWKRSLIRSIETLTGRPLLERIYWAYRSAPDPKPAFFDAAIEKLNLEIQCNGLVRDLIPREGPVVLVGNHPYGVLDGIVACHLMAQARPDFRVLANSVLWRAEELQECLLPIDFSETREALKTNLTSRRAARDFLEQGGAVVVFPAGAVSTTPSFFARQAVDRRWGTFTAQLIHRARSPVLPLYFEGQNSRLFQWASHIHDVFRVALLFKEVRSRMGTPFGVRVGDLISYEELSDWGSHQSMMDVLWGRTYGLSADRAATPTTWIDA